MRLAFVFAALMLAITAVAGTFSPSEAQSELFHVNAKNGLALEGYDPVSYHTQGKPIKGDAALTSIYQGATFHFSSAENKAAFDAAPQTYAAAYGGFCAYGVAQGYKVNGDPKVWKIVDGTLYLNFNQGVQRRWEKDIPGHISEATTNWAGIEKADPKSLR